MNVLLILYSYHHHNTEKVALVLSDVLKAEIRTPNQVDIEELKGYDLVGFGSGIYGDRHHRSLLELADRMPRSIGLKVFIFSTNGSPDVVHRAVERDRRTGLKKEPYATRVHKDLRDTLRSRGCSVVGESSCQGWNTNSFLKVIGGINKGRPDADDLRRAKEFALMLAARGA